MSTDRLSNDYASAPTSLFVDVSRSAAPQRAFELGISPVGGGRMTTPCSLVYSLDGHDEGVRRLSRPGRRVFNRRWRGYRPVTPK